VVAADCKPRKNAQFGLLNEAYLRTALRVQLADNYDNVADQARIRPSVDNGKPADFYFIADHLARNRQTGGIVAIEGKLKPSAPFTKPQQIGSPLFVHNGGTVISRNAPEYPYGTHLPPSPVVRAEPTVNLETTPRPQGKDIDFNFEPIK